MPDPIRERPVGKRRTLPPGWFQPLHPRPTPPAPLGGMESLIQGPLQVGGTPTAALPAPPLPQPSRLQAIPPVAIAGETLAGMGQVTEVILRSLIPPLFAYLNPRAGPMPAPYDDEAWEAWWAEQPLGKRVKVRNLVSGVLPPPIASLIPWEISAKDFLKEAALAVAATPELAGRILGAVRPALRAAERIGPFETELGFAAKGPKVPISLKVPDEAALQAWVGKKPTPRQKELITKLGYEIEEDAAGKVTSLKAIPQAPVAARPQVVAPRVAPAAVPEVAAALPPRPPVPPSAVPPISGGKTPDDVLRDFAGFIHSPESLNLSQRTVEIRKAQLSQRLGHLQRRTEELLNEGRKAEDALRQAQAETMTGKFDRPVAILTQTMADEFREAAFAKLTQVLISEPLERMSTAEALQNALLGQGIPRKLGTAGGSAYTRLSRIFPPEIMEILDKPGALQDRLEALLLTGPFKETKAWPFPIPELRAGQPGFAVEGLPRAAVPADLRSPIERQLDLMDFKAELSGARRGVSGKAPFPPKPEIAEKQHLMDLGQHRNIFASVLKEAGWTLQDIGLAWKANKASFDFSWWRQVLPLIPNNFRAFLRANAAAWRGTWSKAFAEQAEKLIKQDKYYPLYEAAAKKGYDFLLPLSAKGVPAWQRAEPFMVLGETRPIPKFVQKVPWIRLSNRAFVTGINDMSMSIFTRYVDDLFRYNEKIAAGAVKMKPGKAFSIEKEAMDYAAMLADMTGRAKLGPLKQLSPAMNSLFFSLRYNLGRFFAPRHLISANPRVRKEAAKNLVAFVGTIGGILLLGRQLGLWDVEFTPLPIARFGNYRYDPWGGFAQSATFLTRLITQQQKTASGLIRPTTVSQTTSRFVRGKVSPAPQTLIDFWTGTDFLGNKVDIKNPKQWIERIAPMAISDIMDAVEESGVWGFALGFPSEVGTNVGVYTRLRDVQNEEAQRIYGKPYAQLKNRGQRAVVDSSANVTVKMEQMEAQAEKPDIYTETSIANQKWRDFKAASELGLREKIEAGRTGSELKQSVQEFKKERFQVGRALFTGPVKEQMAKSKAPFAFSPADILAEEYWSAPLVEDLKTGELKWNLQKEFRDEILAQAGRWGINPSYITGTGEGTYKGKRFEDSLVRGVVEEYEEAVETTRPYWEIADEVERMIEAHPQLGPKALAIWKEFKVSEGDKASQLRRQHDFIGRAESVLETLRKQLRAKNPAIDAALKKWWGRTSLQAPGVGGTWGTLPKAKR